jgi:2-polyprenyl-3-methyl-5-hydroxy-6-metoxy-1,4-benzoquinol methylase
VRTVADRQQLEHELEWLWQFHLRRLKPGAPVHQLFDRAIFSQRLPLHLVQCRECATVFRSPRERGEDVVEVYEAEQPSASALASLFEQQYAFYRPRVRKITTLSGRSGSVLEVGSYVGGFLRAAADAGWQACGLDVNASANEFARSHGVPVVESSLEDFSTDRRFDVIAIWNCFDQLPDPHAALRAASALLNREGWLVIRVPNGAYYAARAKHRRWLHYRARLAWNNLATFPYRHGFTPKSLTRLLNEHGYRVKDVVPDRLVLISSDWTRAWARWEERVLKSAMGLTIPGAHAPWFEIYARRS